nr:integrin beta-PS-like isoform X2 [Cherax quadricarinatus]
MMQRVIVMVMMVVVWVMCASYTPDCNTRKSCADCIRSGCMWCGKENFTDLPRCSKKNESLIEKYYEICEEYLIDPLSYVEITEDEKLSTGDAHGQEDTIIQIRPQKVDIESRVGEAQTIKFTYKHLKNYPVDLYYLMDGSKSMKDDKEMLTQLGKQLVESIKNITSNFRVGFGIFVDKAILPYISTLPFNADSCPECEAPFSYKNILSLTDDSSIFVNAVKESKVASNIDYPEGGFDGLMQAIVCEREIDWRNQSTRLIVLSTDAGFHIAGDGKISEMADSRRMQLIFAVTQEQEPLYSHLKELIPRTSFSILEQDSSNIISILTSQVKDIINRVTINVEGASDAISVQLYSKCKDEKLEERTQCNNLNAGDEVEFKVVIQVNKCPKDQDEWMITLFISPEGHKQALTIDLTMMCDCKCEQPGDQGFIVNADQCSKVGDYKCGVCSCHPGYIGDKCECELSGNEVQSTDESCKLTNSSLVCSGQGDCICGMCVCKTLRKPEKIWGDFCECTNYQGCTSPNGILCSNNGNCDCNKCICNYGWIGQFCECENGTQENCINPQVQEMCSGHGTCECNQCRCIAPYFGKFCEDCLECPGKCDEFKSCVECQLSSGEESSLADCHTNCTLFDFTLVESIAEMSGPTCTFFDKNNCRVHFLYKTSTEGKLYVWVQKNLECPTYHNIYFSVLGVLIAVVVIGLATIIAWRIIVSIHDKREYAKFILDQQSAKWSENVSPIYKPAVTEVKNPLFGVKTD